MAGTKSQEPVSLTRMVESLSPESWYQSPGGRRSLLALAMAAGVPRGARVLDVQCGIGSGSVDLAELYEARVTAFDDYPPYLAFGRQQAASRGVGKRATFQSVAGTDAQATIPAESFDVVLGLGGGLSDTLPGGLAGGLSAAASWLVNGGILILGDLVTPGPTSELMKHVFGETLISEQSYFAELEKAGFEVILAFRSSSNDWDQMAETMQKLRERKLDLGTEDERQRQSLTTAARNHPELAYLNVLCRKNT